LLLAAAGRDAVPKLPRCARSATEAHVSWLLSTLLSSPLLSSPLLNSPVLSPEAKLATLEDLGTTQAMAPEQERGRRSPPRQWPERRSRAAPRSVPLPN